MHLTRPELKQLVHRPDVVEEHDVAAADPRLLVFLKVPPPPPLPHTFYDLLVSPVVFSGSAVWAWA